MAAPVLDLNAVTADNSKQLSSDYKLKHKLDTNPPRPKAPPLSIPKREVTFNKRDAELLDKQLAKADKEEERHDVKAQTAISATLRKVDLYHTNPVLGPIVGPSPRYDRSSITLAQAKALLGETRNKISLHRAQVVIPNLFETGLERLESFLVENGYHNTIGLEGLDGNFVRRGLVPMLKQTHILDVEMQEMIIELQDWATAPWYVRLVTAVYGMAKQYSDGRLKLSEMRNMPTGGSAPVQQQPRSSETQVQSPTPVKPTHPLTFGPVSSSTAQLAK